jgi:hypothetical protein
MAIRLVVMFGLLAVGAFAQNGSRTFNPPVSRPPAVSGKPYFGESALDNLHYLSDGTRLTQRSSAKRVYRDGQGRVRTEESLSFGPLTATAPLLVEIEDVVAGVQYLLDVQAHVAHRFAYPPARTPSSTPPAGGPKFQAVTENLGTQTIDGIVAEGTRTTLSYPAGTWGFESPIATVSESWRSKEFGLIVQSKNTNPMSGDLMFKLSNVRFGEQDVSLFQVPAGYTVRDETGPFIINYPQP